MAPSKSSAPLSDLQLEWKELYSTTLPKLATSHDPVQPKWPVHVDHCFGRIILDNTVGSARTPWMRVVKSPAYRNMSDEQLREAIDLGRKIQSGAVNLVELDEISLRVRGKKGKSGKFTRQEVATMQKKISTKPPAKESLEQGVFQDGRSGKKRNNPTDWDEPASRRKSTRTKSTG